MISETIFSSKYRVIPMADVCHIEKAYESCDLIGENATKRGELSHVVVIMTGTKWNFDHGTWENAMFIPNGKPEKEAEEFLRAWSYYRYEKDVKPTEMPALNQNHD